MTKSEGISNKFIFRDLLRHYYKKASMARPVYQTFTEETPTGTHYRSQVWVDGICFKPPHTFPDRLTAENGAARHVLIDILEKVKIDEPVGILEDTSICKPIVNAYALKMNMEQKMSPNKNLNLWQPTYTTESTKALIPMFISSLKLNGATYVGKPAKNKKEADKLAARSAILSILGSQSNTTMSHIVKSKFKFYNSLKKVKDFTGFQALTSNVDSGVNGAVVAEIPQPSPLVPSGQVPDVNQNGALKSAMKCDPDTTSQAQSEFSQVFKKGKLKDLTSANAPLTELVVPLTEFAPPASGQAPSSGIKKYHKEKEGQLHQSPLPVDMISQSPPPVAMIDSGDLLSFVDKNNEAYRVDEAVVAEIPQPDPLVPSGQVLVVNQNVLLESAVERALATSDQDQPKCIHVFQKPELLQDSTPAVAPLTEFVPHASEQATTSGSNESSVAMISQSSPHVALIDSGALLSVDKNNEAHGVDASAVAEIAQPDSLVPSSQVLDVNQNVLLESAMKRVAESTTQDQPEYIHVFKKPELLQASTSAIAPLTELVIPCTQFLPPAQDPASGKKRNREKKKGQLPQSSGLLSVVDKTNEAHVVDGGAVVKISQPSPLVPSGQVPGVIQNGPLKSDVERAPDTTSQAQPEFSKVSKKRKLKASTSAIAPPTELVVPHLDFVPPASEPASKSRKLRKQKRNKGQVHQSPSSVAMVSQSSPPVALIDSGALLSVDKSNVAHGVDGSEVSEIAQPGQLVPSGQVPDVNQNVLLVSAVKRDAEATTQDQMECIHVFKKPELLQALTSAIIPPPELVIPLTESMPPAQDPASGKKRNHKKKKCQLPQSPGLLSVVDKTNEAHVVDGGAVVEISQPSPLVLSGQVPGVIQNGPLKSDVERAPDTTSQAQPEFSKVSKKRKLKASTSAIASPTELVAPHLDFVPPASEPALISRKLRKQKRNKGLPVAMIDSSGLLSVVDKNNEAHAIDGGVVAEISQPRPLVPSGQVPDVNKNGAQKSALKWDPDTTSQAQPEFSQVFKKGKLKDSTSANAPPTELVVSLTEFVSPASEQAPSGMNKYHKENEEQLHQCLLPGSMIAQGPAPVAAIAQSSDPAYSVAQ